MSAWGKVKQAVVGVAGDFGAAIGANELERQIHSDDKKSNNKGKGDDEKVNTPAVFTSEDQARIFLAFLWIIKLMKPVDREEARKKLAQFGRWTHLHYHGHTVAQLAAMSLKYNKAEQLMIAGQIFDAFAPQELMEANTIKELDQKLRDLDSQYYRTAVDLIKAANQGETDDILARLHNQAMIFWDYLQPAILEQIELLDRHEWVDSHREYYEYEYLRPVEKYVEQTFLNFFHPHRNHKPKKIGKWQIAFITVASIVLVGGLYWYLF